ncbi:MAG: DUF362 domain-containing protein [Clostridiales bacterium]|nr:DUF362 domain-containing protein [Clostridiales bacterium]
MNKSNVYFTSFRVADGENLMQKLRRLCKKAGMERIDFKDKFTAIKMHFGEPGNLAFLRPNYAKTVVDHVADLGGKPFLTDANTLYTGKRRNALDHLDTAYTNGFSPFSAGCHVLIADGLKGTDDIKVDIQGDYVRQAKIGRAVMDADVFVSLTHFKGHEATGFGGTLKNIGMGCGSYEGKREMHSAEKPAVNRELCVGCERCAAACAHDAISMSAGKAYINTAACTGCGRCITTCPEGAIRPMNDQANIILVKKIAEYALAVVQGRPCFHISLIMDVSPFCDCYSANDAPIVPDVGMLAAFDPVALDQACADLVNNQVPVRDSLLGERARHHNSHDHFHTLFSGTDWQAGLAHAEKIGLGTRQYELVTMR